MSKIDIDRFICSLIERQGVYRNNHAISELQIILDQQGLHYRNGEIVEVDQPPLTEESNDWFNKDNWKGIKPQTIKFNESEDIDSVWPKEIVDELLEETQKNTPKVKEELKKYFSNVFPTIYDIDVDKMVEKYKEEESKVLLPLGFSKGNIEHLSIAYRNGLKDMLKLIKGGGE